MYIGQKHYRLLIKHKTWLSVKLDFQLSIHYLAITRSPKNMKMALAYIIKLIVKINMIFLYDNGIRANLWMFLRKTC